MSINITYADGMSSQTDVILNDNVRTLVPNSWVLKNDSGKVSEWRLSDPDALGHPGTIRVESRERPNIYDILPVSRSMQSPVKGGQHVYIQKTGVITRYNDATDDMRMYPRSLSLNFNIPTDPVIADDAVRAILRDLEAIYLQLKGQWDPVTIGEVDQFLPANTFSTVLSKLLAGTTKSFLQEDAFADGE